MGGSSTSTSTEPVTPVAAGGAMAVISLGEMLVTSAGWPPTSTVSASRKPMPWIDDGAAGSGQARRRDGVGVEQPAVVGVVGAAVAAQVGNADAHDVVAAALTRSQVSPVARPLRPGAAPTGAAPTASKASQTPMRGHGFCIRRRAGLVEGLGDNGEDAIAANREGEPVGLAHLAQASAPQAARRARGAAAASEPMASLIAARWRSRRR